MGDTAYASSINPKTCAAGIIQQQQKQHSFFAPRTGALRTISLCNVVSFCHWQLFLASALWSISLDQCSRFEKFPELTRPASLLATAAPTSTVIVSATRFILAGSSGLFKSTPDVGAYLPHNPLESSWSSGVALVLVPTSLTTRVVGAYLPHHQLESLDPGSGLNLLT